MRPFKFLIMRFIIFSLVFFLASCNTHRDEQSVDHNLNQDTTARKSPILRTDTVNASKIYANARFRNVAVTKVAANTYKLTGEAQIFEASFNWVIEDGHNELQSGYSTTDAGAPAWGKFDFTVKAQKLRENSMLHIILFEASAEDGRRTHELPVPLH